MTILGLKKKDTSEPWLKPTTAETKSSHTEDQREVETHLALCHTRKATLRAQQKGYWHPGTGPKGIVWEDVGVLGR